MKVPEALEYLTQEEEQKLIDMDSVARTAVERVEQAGIIFVDEIDKIAGREGSARAGRQPRRRAARHPADRRRHDRQHEVRDGADRSHPVHRGRRVSRVEAVGSHPRAAGPLPDPRRARAARQGGIRPDPDRAAQRPGQAVHGADGDRGHRARRSPPMRSTGSPTSPRWSTSAPRTSAPAGCTP